MTETDDLVARLMNGIVEHPKRWSGDTHHDLGGSCDYEKTDKLMSQAAARLEAQSRALTASQDAIDTLTKRVRELEGALKPFAFLDDESTQEAWEIRYQDRFKDWIDFGDMESARAALTSEPPPDPAS